MESLFNFEGYDSFGIMCYGEILENCSRETLELWLRGFTIWLEFEMYGGSTENPTLPAQIR